MPGAIHITGNKRLYKAAHLHNPVRGFAVHYCDSVKSEMRGQRWILLDYVGRSGFSSSLSNTAWPLFAWLNPFEPQSAEKTYFHTCAQRRLQSACASALSDQFVVHEKNCILGYPKMYPVKILIRLRECAG